MKRLLLITLCYSILSNVFAQSTIPNMGFENWELNKDHPPYEYDDPDAWGMEVCASGGGDWQCEFFAEKSSDAYAGNYAMKVVNGAINSANVISNAEGTFGHPFTDTPENISFYYKSNLVGTDSVEISVSLFNDNFDIYSSGKTTIGADVTTYTQHEISLEVEDESITTTSILISIKIEDENGDGNPNSWFLIDELSFDGANNEPTALNDSQNQKELMFYPNPVNQRLHFNQVINYTIYTVHGTPISNSKSNSVDVSNLEQGTYLLKMESLDGKVATKTFVKE